MIQVHYIYCALYSQSDAATDLTRRYWSEAWRLVTPAL